MRRYARRRYSSRRPDENLAGVRAQSGLLVASSGAKPSRLRKLVYVGGAARDKLSRTAPRGPLFAMYYVRRARAESTLRKREECARDFVREGDENRLSRSGETARLAPPRDRGTPYFVFRCVARTAAISGLTYIPRESGLRVDRAIKEPESSFTLISYVDLSYDVLSGSLIPVAE